MSEVTELRAYIPIINEIRCTGCGDCVIACPIGAQVEKKGLLKIIGGKCKVIDPDLCDGCGVCLEACSVDAIRIDFTRK
ncbi:MAG: ATP-binding protein [Candidatus Helarchaeota archaeon]